MQILSLCSFRFIEALTWKQNKYNLFDYENKKLTSNKFKFQKGFLIYYL